MFYLKIAAPFVCFSLFFSLPCLILCSQTCSLLVPSLWANLTCRGEEGALSVVPTSTRAPQKPLYMPNVLDALDAERSKEAQQDIDVWVHAGCPSRTNPPEPSSAKNRSKEAGLRGKVGNTHILLFCTRTEVTPRSESLTHSQIGPKARLEPDLPHWWWETGSALFSLQDLGGFLEVLPRIFSHLSSVTGFRTSLYYLQT